MRSDSIETQDELDERIMRSSMPDVIKEEIAKGTIARKKTEARKNGVKGLIKGIFGVVGVILFLVYLINYHFYLFG